MRRKDREVTEVSEKLAIIDQCKVCRIALEDKEGLYIVPMNYGYVYENEELVLYFHSAKEGRKIDAIKENSNAAFEMDCQHGLIAGDTACEYGYRYKSVIGKGTAAFIEDTEEKKKALSAIMKHQTGEDFTFEDRMLNAVAVFKITADNFTGKDHK